MAADKGLKAYERKKFKKFTGKQTRFSPFGICNIDRCGGGFAVGDHF
jgi:hypothetical protein